jgi:hypothetical protein
MSTGFYSRLGLCQLECWVINALECINVCHLASILNLPPNAYHARPPISPGFYTSLNNCPRFHWLTNSCGFIHILTLMLKRCRTRRMVCRPSSSNNGGWLIEALIMHVHHAHCPICPGVTLVKLVHVILSDSAHYTVSHVSDKQFKRCEWSIYCQSDLTLCAPAVDVYSTSACLWNLTLNNLNN